VIVAMVGFGECAVIYSSCSINLFLYPIFLTVTVEMRADI